MRKFHHVGLPTDQVQPNETYVPDTKVYVTSPFAHPYKVEFLRYEPDSPVTGPLRELPHMAFETDNLKAELKGQKVILGPFTPMAGLTVAFILKDGAVFEFMEGKAKW
jgi:hypothetical protein